MPRRKPPADKNQLPLPISREQRFGSLRKIDPKQLGVGIRQWGRVVDLLEQVELCGQRDGCFAYADTLASRMDGLIGVSKNTLHRARRIAEGCGLLVVSRRHDGRRQQSSEWSVEWDRVMVLAGGDYGSNDETEEPSSDQNASLEDQSASQTQTTETPSIYSPTGTRSYQTGTRSYQTGTLYRGTVSSLISSSLGSTKGQHPEWGVGREVGRPDEEERRETKIPRLIGPPTDTDRAEHQMRKIGKPKTRRDCELVWKLVAISEHVLGDHWLEDAIEGVRTIKPRNPYGYLTTSLQESAKKLGYSFNQLLARTKPPPISWKPFSPDRPDMSERACSPASPEDY